MVLSYRLQDALRHRPPLRCDSRDQRLLLDQQSHKLVVDVSAEERERGDSEDIIRIERVFDDDRQRVRTQRKLDGAEQEVEIASGGGVETGQEGEEGEERVWLRERACEKEEGGE